MTLRERIEESPVVFFLATLAAGFAAGIAVYKAVLEIAELDTIGGYTKQCTVGVSSFRVWRSAHQDTGGADYGGCCLEFAERVQGYSNGRLTVEFAGDDRLAELKIESGPFGAATSTFIHRGEVQKGPGTYPVPTLMEGFDRFCIAFVGQRQTPQRQRSSPLSSLVGRDRKVPHTRLGLNTRPNNALEPSAPMGMWAPRLSAER